MAGDRFAVDALGLFAKPFDEAGAIGDLALGLGQRLAHFGAEDGAQIILVRHHQVKPFAHDRRAFLAGAGGPFLLRLCSGGDGAGGFGAAEVRHTGDHVAAGGVGHFKAGAVVGVDPFTGHIGLGGEQGRIFEKRAKIGDGIKHAGLLCPDAGTEGRFLSPCPVRSRQTWGNFATFDQIYDLELECIRSI